MSALWVMLGCGAALILGARFYAPVIARVLGERDDRPTPAVTINDGRDYVPTRTPVVFAHHYASIAGAGPIIGPVLALYYGWLPALLWIVLGGIFLGAVHDYVATHIAVREGGKNLTVIARRYVGPAAFVMMLVLLVSLLALVCAAFLDLSATALTSMVPVKTLQLDPDQTLFRAQNIPNAITGVVEPHAVIGGIASTSVVVITACSPLIGFLYLKKRVPVWICSLMAIGICALSIWIGLQLPMAVSPLTWKLLISGYVLISAGLPVWLFLQSRDFINVHILYVGIIFLIIALAAAAIRGGGFMEGSESIPNENWTAAGERLGPGWPILFITIACGAVSGFHSLCAGGTTCKQLNSERAGRRVGYYGMLLESFLAVCVVLCLVVGLRMIDYQAYCYPEGAKGNAILTFALAVGRTANIGLGIPVAAGALGAMLLLEGFLVTTLDTAIRLTRYMIEEGWATFFGKYDVFADKAVGHVAPIDAAVDRDQPAAAQVTGTGGLTTEKIPTAEYAGGLERKRLVVETRGLQRVLLQMLRHYWVNSGLAVAFMLALGLGGGYKTLWSIFGSSNQLLAALALLVGTCWLIAHRRPIWYTLLPTVFMLVTSVTMLVRLLVTNYVPNWPATAPLAITAVIVLVMTAGIMVLALRRWLGGGRDRREEVFVAASS